MGSGSAGGAGGGGYYGGGGGGAQEGVGPGVCKEGGGGGGGSSFVIPGAVNVTQGLDSTGTPMIEITAPLPAASSPPVIGGELVAGDVLSEGHAVWSNGPTAYAYQWERCDPVQGCGSIAGATAQTYTLSTNDVGFTMRVHESATNFYGTGTSLSSSTGTVVARTAPVNSSLPRIVGTPLRGRPLALSLGSWENSPSAFAYQWQRCNAVGSRCINLGGASGPTYIPVQADVGATLRMVVTASNVFGSSAATSAASAVVGSQVEAAMTWGFGVARRFTIVESLTVHQLPTGARVEVTCHGLGCPFAHAHSASKPRCHGSHGHRCKRTHASSEVSLAHLFQGRHLGVGTRIEVNVVKPGWEGKAFLFTTRAGTKPRIQFACLAPGSNRPGAGC
jgi:hypothetical protein